MNLESHFSNYNRVLHCSKYELYTEIPVVRYRVIIKNEGRDEDREIIDEVELE